MLSLAVADDMQAEQKKKKYPDYIMGPYLEAWNRVVEVVEIQTIQMILLNNIHARNINIAESHFIQVISFRRSLIFWQ